MSVLWSDMYNYKTQQWCSNN